MLDRYTCSMGDQKPPPVDCVCFSGADAPSTVKAKAGVRLATVEAFCDAWEQERFLQHLPSLRSSLQVGVKSTTFQASWYCVFQPFLWRDRASHKAVPSICNAPSLNFEASSGQGGPF